ncbi:MAG: hypothetical protein HY764_03825 [Candidatus Portnoybacteria bacterium]|nr:hypothetical protein [Candidatus Portnoybacteria bacterium]
MEKWEKFLSRAMVGGLGEKVREAVMANPASRDDIKIVIKAAVEFGGLSDEAIIEKYGPSPFRG